MKAALGGLLFLIGVSRTTGDNNNNKDNLYFPISFTNITTLIKGYLQKEKGKD